MQSPRLGVGTGVGRVSGAGEGSGAGLRAGLGKVRGMLEEYCPLTRPILKRIDSAWAVGERVEAGTGSGAQAQTAR